MNLKKLIYCSNATTRLMFPTSKLMLNVKSSPLNKTRIMVNARDHSHFVRNYFFPCWELSRDNFLFVLSIFPVQAIEIQISNHNRSTYIYVRLDYQIWFLYHQTCFQMREDCKLSTKLEQEIQNFLVEIRDSSKIGRMFLSDSYNSLKVNVSHTSKIQLRYTKKEDN